MNAQELQLVDSTTGLPIIEERFRQLKEGKKEDVIGNDN